MYFRFAQKRGRWPSLEQRRGILLWSSGSVRGALGTGWWSVEGGATWKGALSPPGGQLSATARSRRQETTTLVYSKNQIMDVIDLLGVKVSKPLKTL